ncbi:DEAD/DEAH box helicase [Oscillatoria sp. CS-180]|uniref:DEAD/DEAH box helicase n=1 Tax=Oscillatoria sp. CS-180 TaxID=3021720 RepID=UPI00232E17BF|nr:DEAD/DEAH box helicase [Oscillatoria sp. CS-180]MDB9527594.1 DEAD/DEAH box helicase [Oscillatoria sp. CS-180]
MSFENLGLSDKLLRAIADQGYDTPTPIQAEAIPAVLEQHDVLASAQTGTGKTASFTLPILHLLSTTSQPGKGRKVRALVLTPTRELAAQVEDSIKTYGKYMPLRVASVYGGVRMGPQIGRLRRGVDVLVATPGRLLDHISQGTVDLSFLDVLVLDEADRMLDMGFIHDIRKIIEHSSAERQTLLFSATFSRQIKRLADDLLRSPKVIEVARTNTVAENVTQVVHPVDRHRKRELLSHMIGSRNWQRVLVFTRTKHGANRLAEQLQSDGLSSDTIHGNKSQGARARALDAFKRGKVRVLVATDVAARGLDIDELPHVVNFDLPNVAEDYVHRIGRTGRAGNEGDAISLVCVDEHYLLRNIERLLKRDIPQSVIPGYEPDPSIAPEPIPGAKRPGNKQRRGGGRYQARNGNARRSDGYSRRPSRSKRGGKPTAAPILKKASNAAAGKDDRKRA